MNSSLRLIVLCAFKWSVCCRQLTLTVIREFFTNISYKLPSENSLQTVLKSYYHRTYSKQCLQTIVIEIIPSKFYKLLLSEKWLQTIVRNYYQIIHYKQYLKTVIRKLIHFKQYLPTIIREVTPNNAYKLLSGKLLPKNNYKLLSESSIQTDNTYKLLPENALQKGYANYYQRTPSK